MDTRLEILTRKTWELAARYYELRRLRKLVEEAERSSEIERAGRRVEKAQNHRAIHLCGRAVAEKRAPALERSLILNIINSQGIHVAQVRGAAIFDLGGRQLYRLRGINIYRLSGELVGHLPKTQDTEKRLDRSGDRLFSVTARTASHDRWNPAAGRAVSSRP